MVLDLLTRLYLRYLLFPPFLSLIPLPHSYLVNGEQLLLKPCPFLQSNHVIVPLPQLLPQLHLGHQEAAIDLLPAHFFLGKGAGQESVNRLYDVMGQFATKLKVEQGDETGMRIRTHIHSRNTYASMGEEEHIPRIVKAV